MSFRAEDPAIQVKDITILKCLLQSDSGASLFLLRIMAIPVAVWIVRKRVNFRAALPKIQAAVRSVTFENRLVE